MNLKQILKDCGVSQTALADMLGVSKQYVNNLVSGRQDPGLQTIKQVSALLNIPMWRFFYDEEPQASPRLTALVECRGVFYKASSTAELRQIADTIEKSTEHE